MPDYREVRDPRVRKVLEFHDSGGLTRPIKTSEDLAGLNALKSLQKEFQQKYCSSCGHFDPDKGDFRQKGHLNDPKDCRYHWTDYLGQCQNYHSPSDSNSDIPRTD